MTRQANLMGSGVSPQAAYNTVGTFSNTQTATGSSSQANSFAITDDVTVFTTAASNSGARLPSNASPPDSFIIANQDSNTMIIYPPVGGKLNNGTTDAGVNLTTKKAAECINIGGLNFLVMLGG